MRKLLLFAALLLCGSLLSAQVEYTLDEETRAMSQGVENAFILSVQTDDVRLVESLWKDYLKDYDAKPKKVRGGDELLADDADIPGVGAGNTVDVYATFEGSGDETEIVVWFNLGGAYLNSMDHPSRVEDGRRFLERFVIEISRELIREEMKAEEGRLKDLEKELDNLEKEKSKLLDDIAEAEETIRRAQAAIADNEEAQLARQRDIEEQKKVIEAVRKRKKDLD
jgi:hypothetical protein